MPLAARQAIRFVLTDIDDTLTDHGRLGSEAYAALGLQGREQPMRLFGPRGAKRVLGAALGLGVERGGFAIEIVELEPGEELARLFA